jgi:tetratricopeptide (TPR) repeat protein
VRTGAGLAARFAAAKENLYLGHAAQILPELGPLLSSATRQQYPILWQWASNDRCVALRSLGRHAEAITCLSALVPQFDAMGEPKEAANTLCNLGATLGAQGRWDEARGVLEGCAQRRERLGAPAGIAHAELLLGWESLETQSPLDAVGHFERAAHQAALTADTGREWDARRWQAQAWLDVDEVARARAALEAIPADPVQDSSRHAQWQLAMAQVDLYSDEPAGAVLHFGKAVEGYSRNGQIEALGFTQCLWSIIDAGQPISADCDPLIAAQGYLHRGDAGRAAALLAKKTVGSQRELFRRFLLALATNRDDASARAAFVDLVGEARRLGGTTSRESNQKGQILARMGYELAARAVQRGDEGLARLAFACLWQAGDAVPVVGQRLQGEPWVDRVAADEQDPVAVSSPPPGTVVVASTSFLGNGYLLVARSEHVEVLALDMPRLQGAISRWRESLIGRTASLSDAAATADALHLRQWWSADDARLVLSVHSALAALPWAALPIEGEPFEPLGYRPLLAQAAVVEVTRSDAPAVETALAAHAIYLYPEQADPALPGTQWERDAIAGVARQAGWTVSGEGMSRGAILHIAGHAVADPILPAGGHFTASTGSVPFPGERMSNARLVVLAGCDTGMGALSRWSQPASLARRAIDAGAAAALAHLWPIMDSSAAQLHLAFYRHLLSGEDEETALRNAQLEQMSRPTTRQPYHWASPILLVRRHAGLLQPVAAAGVRALTPALH